MIGLAAVAAGSYLRSNGVAAPPIWSTLTLPNAASIGDLLYASAANTISALADVATGNALISGGVGVAPAWGKIGLTTHVSGTLAIGSGGTGQTTATAAFNALSPLTTRGDLLTRDATNNVRLGVGAANSVLTANGTDPSWSATPTVTTLTTTSTASFGDTATMRKDQNNTSAGFIANNQTNGSIASAAVECLSNEGTLVLAALSQSYTTGTYDVTRSAVLAWNGRGGLSIAATDAAGAIRFYPGGTGEKVRIETNGRLEVSNGDAAGPGVNGLNDTNTGIYWTGSDVLGLSTGGTARVLIGPGVQVGAPTGGDKGAGTINIAGDIYQNNTAYTNPDYAFEHYFTGQIRHYRDRPGAAAYQGLRALDDLRSYLQREHHFPQIDPAQRHGAFDRADLALELIEEAHLYILQLHDRLTTLEQAP